MSTIIYPETSKTLEAIYVLDQASGAVSKEVGASCFCSLARLESFDSAEDFRAWVEADAEKFFGEYAPEPVEPKEIAALPEFRCLRIDEVDYLVFDPASTSDGFAARFIKVGNRIALQTKTSPRRGGVYVSIRDGIVIRGIKAGYGTHEFLMAKRSAPEEMISKCFTYDLIYRSKNLKDIGFVAVDTDREQEDLSDRIATVEF